MTLLFVAPDDPHKVLQPFHEQCRVDVPGATFVDRSNSTIRAAIHQRVDHPLAWKHKEWRNEGASHIHATQGSDV